MASGRARAGWALLALAAVLGAAAVHRCVAAAQAVPENEKKALATIEQFLRRMDQREPDLATYYWSATVDPTKLRGQLGTLLEGRAYERLRGPVRIEPKRWTIAKGIFAQGVGLEGEVVHTDGRRHTFKAELLEESDEWLLRKFELQP